MTSRIDLRLREARSVCRDLEAAGFAAMFAGGCVRDRLLGRRPRDFDIATPALPQESRALMLRLGYRVVDVGLKFGTIAVVTDLQHIEITTLRADIACDGRWAEVEYSRDFKTDARRRDFTVNAMFEDSDGRVLDYVGGLSDLEARRLRFVGDPEQRIREDYLRILRYYRLLADLGWPARRTECHAIERLVDGLESLSKERVLAELERILSAPAAEATLELMAGAAVPAHALGWWSGDMRRLLRSIGCVDGLDPTARALRWWLFFQESLGWSLDRQEMDLAMRRLPLSRKLRKLMGLFTTLTCDVLPFSDRLRVCLALLEMGLNAQQLVRIFDRSVPGWSGSGQLRALLLATSRPPPSFQSTLARFQPRQRGEVETLGRVGWHLGWWADAQSFELEVCKPDRLRSRLVAAGWDEDVTRRILELLRTRDVPEGDH